MADLKIRREHRLGLAKARKVAWQWAEEVEERFSMECTVIEGTDRDTIEFTRSGVDGRLLVAEDHFDLEAKLGFLLGAFSATIEAEVARVLDGLLEGGAATPSKAPARKAAAGKTASKAPAKRSKG